MTDINITRKTLDIVRRETGACIGVCSRSLANAKGDVNLAIGFVEAEEHYSGSINIGIADLREYAQRVKVEREAADFEKCVVLGED